MLSLFLTPYCNLKCDYCYVNALPFHETNSPQQLFTVRDWEPIISEARICGYSTLHLFGGEPILYPDLRALCELGIHLGYEILIATNGISFQESDKKWLKELNASISISITFNDINLIWDQQHPIKREWIQFFEENHICFTITTCLTQKNVDDYESFIQNVLETHKTNFFGIFYSPIGRAVFHPDWSINPEKWMYLIKKLTEKYPVRIEQSYLMKKNMTLYLEKNLEECPMYTGQMLTILYNGDVYPCMLLMERSEWRLGTISPKETLNIIIEKLRLKTNIITACPAYWIKEQTDFRTKYITENKEKIAILCPFRSF